ncbi:MAG: Hint domain-containing protein [Paracoccaceae bacterium]
MLFRAEDIYVSTGANLGDGLGGPDEVCPGDIYELADDAVSLRLMVARSAAGAGQSVAAGSQIGTEGGVVRMVSRYTLMGTDGNKVDLLILQLEAALYALPLSPMGVRIEYALLKVEDAPAETPLSDLLCVSFARGTMITLANGNQRGIEALAVGDRVLTRDHGPQPIRWVGRATLRAVGAFAPVVITAGAMGNAGDLIISQHHRMFLYQRDRSADMPTAELLVQAKHLVDGEAVFLREGGFVDYFSLVFDGHEIIYAEGIPAESLMVTDATLSRLPVELAGDVKARFPGLSQVQHFGTEAGRHVVAGLPKRRRRT